MLNSFYLWTILDRNGLGLRVLEDILKLTNHSNS